MKYQITDFEIDRKKVVEAPGMAEAMLEYLPWPTLDLKIEYQPTHGCAQVIDLKTDFMYHIMIL